MKAILISIRPEWVTKILNGEKTIEIRKKFPRDYVGWVYIYVTNSRKHYLVNRYVGVDNTGLQDYPYGYEVVSKKPSWSYNGKVVGRFWCDKIGEIHFVAASFTSKRIVDWNCDEFFAFEKDACLTQEDLDKYLGKVKHSPQGYAIHITKLEIFDKPKEIKEFYKVGCEEYFTKHVFVDHPNFRPVYESELKQFQFACAPQSWCYVEI